ncbi:unnamed protein product [Auanema sp. JU1783]|nr:unnamed protein product [Auanema sp. JU1783]
MDKPNLVVSSSWCQGGRPSMEDKLCLDVQRTESGKLKYALLGVFDGHGGACAADCAAEIFPEQLKQKLSEHSCPKKAMIEAFKATNDLMYQNSKHWKPLSRLNCPSLAGTTATVALICGDTLTIANCGDSVAVLGIKNQYSFGDCGWYPVGIRGSVVHSIKGDEKKRIKRMGGTISDSLSDTRIVYDGCVNHCWVDRQRCSHKRMFRPILNMSRALGDFWSYNADVGDYVISCVPHVASYSLQDDSIFGLCLHTDGVQMSPCAIARCLAGDNAEEKENLARIPKSGCLAEEILNNSMKSVIDLSKTDNATVITVLFDSLLGCEVTETGSELGNGKTFRISA